VLELCGVSISNSDAWWIVDQLRTVGRADDAVSAFAIERALLDEKLGIDLTPTSRQRVFAALVDCPDSLKRLRTTLARDYRERLSR
jgi:hypothetical protein